MTDYIEVRIAEDIAQGDSVVIDIGADGTWRARRDHSGWSLTTNTMWGRAVNEFARYDHGTFNLRHGWLAKAPETSDR